jgi:hypothetical protein
MGQNLRPNGHKFPYGATVRLKDVPNNLGVVKDYSSGENMPTLIWVEFKGDSNWVPEENLILGPDNPSRRDSY